MENILWEETLPGAASWSHVLKRGTALRLIDPEGGANVGAMLFNAQNYVERYNMPDTLKCQHIARFTAGHALYSDMGRVLCSITEDTCGWHDPLCGHSTEVSVRAKYGDLTYQAARNRFHQNARDGFLIELQKYGLGLRDLQANVNFFSKVTVSLEGAMHFDPAHSRAGAYLDLRAEMDTLLILNACQHPLSPAGPYAPKPVQLILHRVPSPTPDDACRTFCPENGRGFTLSERYAL